MITPESPEIREEHAQVARHPENAEPRKAIGEASAAATVRRLGRVVEAAAGTA
jgi:hypothetical protein